ncbi:hypothetical protein GGS20DRAFT_434774 [Poronia punctata]|nr:hypothetical protein GGS20DRAFT_434774 [Poronia punctata]
MNITSLFLFTQQETLPDDPALTPPPGVVPNFDDPPNKNYLGIFTNVICLILTITLVAARLYFKYFCVKKVHVEDYLVVLGLVAFLASVGCNIHIIRTSGLFVHQWNIRLKDFSTVLYVLYIGNNICAVTITLVKAAILLDWIHIFVPLHARNLFFWTCVVVLILNTIFHVTWVTVQFMACIPHQKIWDRLITTGACVHASGLYIPAAAVNLTSNVVILLLPQKEIWCLRIATRDKAAASILFIFTSTLSCASAGMRLHHTRIFYHAMDQLYSVASMYLWTLAETTCLFLVLCVPTAPKVFKKGEKKTRSLLSPRNRHNLGGGNTCQTWAIEMNNIVRRTSASSLRNEGTADIMRSTFETDRGTVTVPKEKCSKKPWR